MRKSKRIFVVADFKDESPRAVFLEERRLVKGLIRQGHDVQRFSYRNMLAQCHPLGRSRKFILPFVRYKADEILAEQIRTYYPDIVIFLSMDYVTENTVAAARKAAPAAAFLGKDGDPFPEKYPKRLAIGKLMDWVVMPAAGQWLQTYKNAGTPRCAFIPFTSDPDLHYKYNVEKKWKTDITFLGAAAHSKLPKDELRYNIAEKLSRMPNAKVYACFGQPKTQGLDCFIAICGAKIGVSINITNDIYLYHSDRFINIPACGTFQMAKMVPGYELMYKDEVQLKYFDTLEEFLELAEWYLKHDDEREKITLAGMEHAHNEFNCTKVAGHLIDLVEKGSYDAPWAVII